jgi:hypothetical protein
MLPKGEVKTCRQELLRLLGFSTETVDSPTLLGAQLFVKRQKAVECLYAVDGQGFLEAFREFYVYEKHLFLQIQSTTLQFIQTAFANAHHLRMLCPETESFL